jgi:hypothetical protein
MRQDAVLMRAAEALRRFEIYGYRVAYCLLENEDLAMEAAMAALLELGADRRFVDAPPDAQRRLVTRSVIRASIAMKRRGAR